MHCVNHNSYNDLGDETRPVTFSAKALQISLCFSSLFLFIFTFLIRIIVLWMKPRVLLEQSWAWKKELAADWLGEDCLPSTSPPSASPSVKRTWCVSKAPFSLALPRGRATQPIIPNRARLSSCPIHPLVCKHALCLSLILWQNPNKVLRRRAELPYDLRAQHERMQRVHETQPDVVCYTCNYIPSRSNCHL